MSPSEGSVSHWLGPLQEGDPDAVQRLWERYFQQLIELARKKLRALPHREAAEDVALSAFDSFCRGAGRGRFPQLADRESLWRLLVVITARKAAHYKRDATRQKRGGAAVGVGSAPPDADMETYLEQIGSTSRAAAWPTSSPASRRRRSRRPGWSRPWPAPCITPTSTGSSTAISSRRTSCWRPTARPRSPTSAWPSAWISTPARREARRSSARPATWPPSRRWGKAGPWAPRRRLRAGRHPLPDAHRPAAAGGTHAAGDRPARRLRGPRRAAIAPAQPASRPGDDLPEVPAQGPVPALWQCLASWPTTWIASSTIGRSRRGPPASASGAGDGAGAIRRWPR